jgi:peptide/nickel transport system permease protein
VLFVVSAVAFGLLAAAGGDALAALSNDPNVSAQAVAELRRVYGLDQPVAVRYLRWLGEVVQGRLGRSFYYQTPVVTMIWPRLLNTAALAFVALAIAWLVSLFMGFLAARRAGSWIDRLCGAVVLIGSSAPRLVLALAALAILSRGSVFQIGGPAATGSPGDWLLRLAPAAVVLGIPLVALFLAQTRESVRATLGKEFVRAARAKGLPERAIILRHVLRPALNPLISVFGYSLGGVLSGSVIVEKVLGWPGLGELSVVAVQSRDVPLLMGVVLVSATAVLAGNGLADLLLRASDPRLRE